MSLEDGKTVKWNEWAKYVLSEVKRFSTEIDRLQQETRQIERLINTTSKDLVKLSSEGSSSHSTTIQDIKNDIVTMQKSIKDLETFKVKVTTVMAILNVILGIALVVISTFKM